MKQVCHYTAILAVFYILSCGQSTNKKNEISIKHNIFDTCDEKIKAIHNSDWDLPLVVFRGNLPTNSDSIIYTETKRVVEYNGVHITINDFRDENYGNCGIDTIMHVELDKRNNTCNISINFVISEQFYDENGEDSYYAPVGYTSRYLNNYSNKVSGNISAMGNEFLVSGIIKNYGETESIGYLKGIVTGDWKYMKLLINLYNREISCILKSGTSTIEQLNRKYNEEDYNAIKTLTSTSINF